MIYSETLYFWNDACGFEALAFQVGDNAVVPRWYEGLMTRGRAERNVVKGAKPELRVNTYGTYWATPVNTDWIVYDPNTRDVWVTKDCDFKREYREI